MRTTFIFAAGLLAGVAVQTAIGQGQNRGIVRMNHVGINVQDIEAAATYYTETIGFKEAFRARDEAGNTRLVYLQVSRDSFVELNQAGEGRPAGLGHFGLHVEDAAFTSKMWSPPPRCSVKLAPKSLKYATAPQAPFCRTCSISMACAWNSPSYLPSPITTRRWIAGDGSLSAQLERSAQTRPAASAEHT
jgi:hypothetical protein